MRAKIVIISKDPAVSELKKTLAAEGHQIFESTDPDQALRIIEKEKPDLVFVDAREFPYEDFCRQGLEKNPDLEFIFITSLDLQARMMKELVLDIAGFLIPPFTPDRIRVVANRVLRQTALARENRRLHAAIAAAKAEWEATVDAIEDPIFIIDFDHNIKRANLAFFKKLNKGVSEVIGKKCTQVIQDISDEQTDSICKKIKETGSSVTMEMELKSLGGVYQLTGYPLVYSGGGGFAIYLRKKIS